MSKEDRVVTNVLNALNDLKTIRTKAHCILSKAKMNTLNHFTLDESQMMPTALYVIEVMKNNYPDFNIPYHSRWRHFEMDGHDRIQAMLSNLNHLSNMARGKILFELVILSVFLDAGAGPTWHYFDPKTQNTYSRSEGLALASLALYQSGQLSAQTNEPFRVDAARLLAFTQKEFVEAFQVSDVRPLTGIEGRVDLMNQLGKAILAHPEYFGQEGRLGDFFSYVDSLQTKSTLTAMALFDAVLHAFSAVWPARLQFHGVSLGDVWTHSALKTSDPGSEFVPFHKLSQWLTYSLIEPLEQSGIQITHLNQLTGLPEYRNGGLLIDIGLLHIKNKEAYAMAHEPGSELIVEWRALTVALLDELAQLIRSELHETEETLPLAKILQGGTWDAGRQIAKKKRLQGTPPLNILSDGTVF